MMPGISEIDVIEIIGMLRTAGIPVWVDGGWCVEALVGRRLRAHDDLDIAVDRAHEPALRARMLRAGFRDRRSVDDRPWSFVLVDDRDRAIDVHVFEFDARGRLVYGVDYPLAALSGRGALGGVEVPCIAAEWMFRFKTAYPPAAKDLLDVRALADTHGFPVPPSHRGV